jgi:hypothetical protein
VTAADIPEGRRKHHYGHAVRYGDGHYVAAAQCGCSAGTDKYQSERTDEFRCKRS